MSLAFRRSVPVVLLTILVAGCGSGVDRPTTVPVEGTVMYNNAPVAGANVSFHTEGAPRAAYGITDAEGHFSLSTFDVKDGAMVGDHVATVTLPQEDPSGPDPMGENASAEDLVASYQEEMNKEDDAESKLPEKYGSSATSPLKFTVTAEGPNKFVLELVD